MDDAVAAVARWAHAALGAYTLAGPSLQLLGQRENITFRVTEHARGEAFLLRLHRPRRTTFAGLRQAPTAIAAELVWLEALTRETPLTVPQPIRNRAGALVTLLPVPDAPPLPCTLLRWVEGQPFDPQVPTATAQVQQLGRLIATLHRHAQTWAIPADFVRPSYGAAFFAQVVARLEPGVATAIITPRDYAVIQQTMLTIGDLLAAMDRAPAHWGLIHNDLHPGNWLVWGKETRPIDFSLCGFGSFVFDLSTSMGSLPVPLRPALWESYGATEGLPANALRLLEACFIVSRLSAYTFMLPDPAQQAWLKGRIPEVVAGICQRFLRGESFVFSVR
jgi:Ser/Thr protein kinase RdoA (MazF antagonist)